MKPSSTHNHNLSLLGVLFLVCIWYGAAALIGAEIILPTPLKTLQSLFTLITGHLFWASVGSTVLRGLSGFVISFIFGVAFGVAAGKSRLIQSFTKPFIVVIRSTPVMSVILLAMIWFKSDTVPVFVTFLMTFPIILGNVIEGVRQVDSRLMEMATFFKVSKHETFVGIELPSLLPFLASGAETALGLTWKVVVAAEVLSQPVHAIGTRLQDSKVYLETASMFAWTIVAILLSVATESVFRLIMKRIPWRPA